jgi:thiamine-phosphate pyrophosphorylase
MAAGSRDRVLGRTGLYLILTDPVIPHQELALAACERGVPLLQLREKRLADRALLALAESIRDATDGSDTLFILNDRADLAALVQADGVHVGQDDIDVESARRIVGPDSIVGLSTHSVEQARSARERDVDYVGLGPVFPTPTKADAEEPIGIQGLSLMAEAAPPVPKVAIGGLNDLNARSTVEAGADFVAVVSFVCHALDPIRALDSIIAALGEGRGHP